MNIFKNISNLFKMKFYFVNELERFPKPAEAEKTKKKKTDAQIKKETIEAGIKYHSSYENNLQRWLDKLSQTEKVNDPEFNTFKNKVAEKILENKEKRKSLEEQAAQNIIKENLNSLRKFVEENGKKFGIEVDEEWNILKQTISFQEEINNLDKTEKLKKLTKVDFKDILNGKVKNLEFSFESKDKNTKNETFSASEIFPKEVAALIENWKKYERDSLTWEFFAWEQNLVIKDKTKLEIWKIRTKEEITKLEEENLKKEQKFLKENKNYDNDEDREIVSTAVSSWLNENETRLILDWKYEDFEKQSKTSQERLINTTKVLKDNWDLDWEKWSPLLEFIKELLAFFGLYKWKNVLERDKDGNLVLDEDWVPKLNDWTWNIPEGLEKEASLNKVREIAVSQLWISEKNWWADKYFKELGYKNLNSRSTPWCWAFVNWVLKKDWYEWTKWLTAKWFIKMEWKGHVAIKVSQTDMIWGNQWNKVGLSKIRKKMVWFAVPTADWLRMFKWNYPQEKIPVWAILVFNRGKSDN